MMIEKSFVVFILSHGRAKNVKTYETLKKRGYTGKTYILCDNEDEQVEIYRDYFGESVIVFDKKQMALSCDAGDNSDNRKVILYARNQCFIEAQKLGVRYFLELDDDYSSFQRRWVEDKKLKVEECYNLDKAFDAMIEFLKQTKAITVAFCQGGDFIGGVKRYKVIAQKGILRKAMNTFFCTTERPFKFVGRINEDVNTYTSEGQRGKLMLSVKDMMITQMTTQANKGGMTETYLDTGTYLKSFYSVMYSPSCVKLTMMGDKHKRIHHKVMWENCTPKIISEKWKK